MPRIYGRDAEIATLVEALDLAASGRLASAQLPSEDTLHALRVASILGSGFSLADLATVSGRPAVDLAMVLAEAIRARVLRTCSPSWISPPGPGWRQRLAVIKASTRADVAGSPESRFGHFASRRCVTPSMVGRWRRGK